MSARMDAAVRGVLGGKISFAQFLAQTRDDWGKLATYLMRRWRVPAGVEHEDVVQELHMGAFKAIATYDPLRGSSPSGFVVYTAVDKAKKWMHRQRGAVLHGNPDAHPGVLIRNFSDMRCNSDKDAAASFEKALPLRIMRLLGTDTPDIEGRIDGVSAWEDARTSAPTAKIRDALAAVECERGSVVDAARSLYADLDKRLRHRLGSEDEAMRAVEHSLRYAAAKLADD